MSPVISAPGAQGKFRRKSSATEWLIGHVALLADKMAAGVTSPSVPWSNCKDDYELKEVIGKLLPKLIIYSIFYNIPEKFRPRTCISIFSALSKWGRCFLTSKG